jgi:HSP20 family protein
MTTNIIKRNNGNENTPATFSGLVDQIFQDNLGRFFNDESWGFTGLTHNAPVPVNIRETGNAYEMELVLPGIKKENLKLDTSDGMLTVSFEQKEEKKQEDQKWLRNEYRIRSFTRSFKLDDNIEADRITAKYNDGILYLMLPKKAEAQKVSKTIDIK